LKPRKKEKKAALAGQIHERWPGLDGWCQVYHTGRSKLEAPNWGGWSGNRIFTNIVLLFADLFAYPETIV